MLLQKVYTIFKNRYVIAIIFLLIFLISRLIFLEAKDIWIDEGHTYLVLHGAPLFNLPPLYFELLRPFVFLFGYTPFGLRILSVIADVIYVVTLFLVTKEL